MLNTRKKRIVLVFKRRVSSTLFNNLSRDLKLVFQDDIEVSKIDLQALKEDEIIDADAILLMRHSAVELLKNPCPRSTKTDHCYPYHHRRNDLQDL